MQIFVAAEMSRQGAVCRPFPPHSPPKFRSISSTGNERGIVMANATAERDGIVRQVIERDKISGSDASPTPASPAQASSAQASPAQASPLDACYGQIGIS